MDQDRAAQAWEDIKEAENESYHADWPPSTAKIKCAGVAVIAAYGQECRQEQFRAGVEAVRDITRKAIPDDFFVGQSLAIAGRKTALEDILREIDKLLGEINGNTTDQKQSHYHR